MKKKGIFLATVALLLTALIIPVVSYSLDTIEKINMVLPTNVYVSDVDLGNQTLEGAIEHIEERANELLSKEITIIFEDNVHPQKHKFTLENLGYTTNKEEIISEISGIINNDLKLIDKYMNYKKIEESGKIFTFRLNIDREKFIKALDVFDESYLTKPVNAQYKYEDDNVIIIGGDVGYTFDKDKLYNQLQENIEDLSLDKAYITLKTTQPEITVEELKNQGIKEKITTFSTRFNAANKPRVANVKLASSIIDGTILAPGEVFSFNETVGERTSDRGFQTAGVYIKGRVEEGIGGGICQVSTTLYNAVLLSDLEVVERSNHSLTVPYVPLSRDASVNWGTKDFKFKNNTDHHIYIHSEVNGNKLIFDLFGTKSNKRIVLSTIKISETQPPIEYIEDEELEVGQEIIEDNGHIGYRSKLIKHVYEDGKLVKSEVINQDMYIPSPKIVKIGIKSVQEILEQQEDIQDNMIKDNNSIGEDI